MPRKKHIHKYHRALFVGGPRTVWACGSPDCNHYMPEHMAHLVLGKMSICFGCGKAFQLTSDSMERDEPICVACALREKGIDIGNSSDIDDIIAAISAKVRAEEKQEEKDKEENK